MKGSSQSEKSKIYLIITVNIKVIEESDKLILHIQKYIFKISSL